MALRKRGVPIFETMGMSAFWRNEDFDDKGLKTKLIIFLVVECWIHTIDV